MTTGVEIKAFLDSLGTLGRIIVGDVPASPDVVGVVKEYGGRATERLYGVVGVGYEKPSVQILFRGIPNDHEGPRNKCEIAWKALAAIQPGTIVSGSAMYLTVDPQQSPFSLGKDPNQRYEIVCNFWLWKEPSP